MKNHKFGIIDVLAILLVIIFVAGIAFRIMHSKNLVTEAEGKCRFTCRIDDVREAGANSVIAGDTLSDGVETVFGKIVDVKKQDFETETTLADGTKKMVKKPGRYTVYATVELDGKWKDNVFYFDDKQSVGTSGNFWVITKHVKAISTITSAVENISE